MRSTFFNLAWAAVSTAFADTCNDADPAILLQGKNLVIKARTTLALEDEAEDEAAPRRQSPYVHPTPALPAITIPTEAPDGLDQPIGNLMQLVQLDDSTYGDIGGRCLDGGMSAYYYGPGTSTSDNGNLWIIYLQGGGGCDGAKECLNHIRSKAPEYENKMWQPDREGEGIMDSSNPDFGGAHRVFIPYCSGDNHLGQVVTPVDGCGENDPATCCDSDSDSDTCVRLNHMYFSGHLNFRNILHHIISTLPAAHHMTDIVLAGSSAGGTGVVHLCDWLQSAVRSGLPQVEVSCAPDSGFSSPAKSADLNDAVATFAAPSFFDDFVESTETTLDVHRDYSMVKINLHHRYMSPRCLNHYTGEEWMCSIASIVYPFIRPRMHITQNKYDSTFIGGNGLRNPTCTDIPLSYIASLGLEWQTTFTEQLKQQDGLWLASCYAHTGNTKDRTLVKGKTGLQAVADWYFQDTNDDVLIDECISDDGLPCNPDNACPLPC